MEIECITCKACVYFQTSRIKHVKRILYKENLVCVSYSKRSLLNCAYQVKQSGTYMSSLTHFSLILLTFQNNFRSTALSLFWRQVVHEKYISLTAWTHFRLNKVRNSSTILISSLQAIWMTCDDCVKRQSTIWSEFVLSVELG